MQKQATITSKGQITVPREVRRILGVRSGDKLLFEDTGIVIDWELREQVWRSAGRAFQAYAERRRKQRDMVPRRILADFLIGAHAASNGCRLLTLDDRLYRAAFPTLAIQTF